jgi:broad specificity phosphatase PhoE
MGSQERKEVSMTQDEIIEMANEASKAWLKEFPTPEETANQVPKRLLEIFAKLVEEHVRNTMNEEAKTHLEELRKNFNAESAELSMHKWIKERYT